MYSLTIMDMVTIVIFQAIVMVVLNYTWFKVKKTIKAKSEDAMIQELKDLFGEDAIITVDQLTEDGSLEVDVCADGEKEDDDTPPRLH